MRGSPALTGARRRLPAASRPRGGTLCKPVNAARRRLRGNGEDAAVDEPFVKHYGGGVERDRLQAGSEQGLELVRTLEVLSEALPPAPAAVLDVGGGPGVYAGLLAQAGYRVHLIDVLPLHVEEAKARAAAQPDAPFEVELGDARDLGRYADASVDAALLLRTLYHLIERVDPRASADRSASRPSAGRRSCRRSDLALRVADRRNDAAVSRRPAIRSDRRTRPARRSAPQSGECRWLVHDGVLPPAGRARRRFRGCRSDRRADCRRRRAGRLARPVAGAARTRAARRAARGGDSRHEPAHALRREALTRDLF